MRKLLFMSMLVGLSFSAATHVGLQSKQINDENSANVELVINSKKDIHGIQFDISFDSNEVQFGSASIDGNYTLETKEIEDGLLRAIVFSMEGKAIANSINLNFLPLNNFEGNSQINFKELILADQNGQEIEAQTSSHEISFVRTPIKTAINSTYPNPFNPSTTISYGLSSDTQVSIMVYDAAGRLVTELVNDSQSAGYHSAVWNASNNASGMYFVKMVAGEKVETSKLMLLK